MRSRCLAAFAAGAIWPLAFAPFGIWPVSVLSLAVLFWVTESVTPRRALAYGFLFGLGMFGAGVWWVFISVHEFGGLHWALAVGITFSLIVIKAGYIAGFAWIAARWMPAAGAWRWLAGLPALWVAVEWFRGWFLSGFPWLTMGYAYTDAPLGAYSPVGGVLNVSLAAALTAGIFGYLVFVRPRWHRAVSVGVLGSVIWGVGAVLERQEFHQVAGEPMQVALLQGNIGQDRKWDQAELLPTIRLYDGLTSGHWDADVILWPEAALPALRYQLDDYLHTLSELALGHNTAVVMGILVWEVQEDRYFNGVMSMGHGEGLYFKRHLVPFGEFFPVPGFVRSWLRMMNLPYSDFTKGPRDQEPLMVRGRPVAASICYEAAYGAEMIRAAPASTLLVNVSNDAWFGDTIAPHQHLQINRQRAREAGRWMLRATNTGITAVIGPDGQVHARLPQFEIGVLRAEVLPLTGSTPYARARNFPVLILVALMLGLAVRFRYS